MIQSNTWEFYLLIPHIFQITLRKKKTEFFSFNIITRHNQLHKKEIEISNNIQKSRTNILNGTGFLPPKNFQKTWPIDWIDFCNYYSRKPRDNNFTYDKLIVTASYWRNKNSETVFPLIEHNREKGHSVSPSPSPETKINYVLTMYTNFCTTSTTTKYVNLKNDIKIQQLFFHDDNKFYSSQVQEEKEQSLKENSKKILSVSDFPISNYELELWKTKNLDFSSSFVWIVYHVCDSSTELPTNIFRIDEISYHMCSYHHQRPKTNIYDTCDDSVGSWTSQRSSELSFQHSTRNYYDCPRQKNVKILS